MNSLTLVTDSFYEVMIDLNLWAKTNNIFYIISLLPLQIDRLSEFGSLQHSTLRWSQKRVAISWVLFFIISLCINHIKVFPTKPDKLQLHFSIMKMFITDERRHIFRSSVMNHTFSLKRIDKIANTIKINRTRFSRGEQSTN